MKKYLTIIKAFWQRALTYRFTVLAYRIGEIMEVFILILMWSAIYGEQELIKGFTLEEMITYVLAGSFFHVVTRNFLEDIVSRDIKDGTLSIYLVKPMGYLSYILTQEIGRISLATILSAISQATVIVFFASTFLWNSDAAYLIVILIMVLLAFAVELLLAYLIGLIAFWTDEVLGLYSTIGRVKKFFSGGYFPLSLLPTFFVEISFFLPFAYSFFIPAQLYLKKISLSDGLWGLLVQVCWIILLYLVIRIVWNRGIKKYEGVGI